MILCLFFISLNNWFFVYFIHFLKICFSWIAFWSKRIQNVLFPSWWISHWSHKAEKLKTYTPATSVSFFTILLMQNVRKEISGSFLFLSRIRETLNLSPDADSITITMIFLKDIFGLFLFLFLFGGGWRRRKKCRGVKKNFIVGSKNILFFGFYISLYVFVGGKAKKIVWGP